MYDPDPPDHHATVDVFLEPHLYHRIKIMFGADAAELARLIASEPGVTYDEISARLGLSKRTVGRILRRLRKAGEDPRLLGRLDLQSLLFGSPLVTRAHSVLGPFRNSAQAIRETVSRRRWWAFAGPALLVSLTILIAARIEWPIQPPTVAAGTSAQAARPHFTSRPDGTVPGTSPVDDSPSMPHVALHGDQYSFPESARSRSVRVVMTASSPFVGDGHSRYRGLCPLGTQIICGVDYGLDQAVMLSGDGSVSERMNVMPYPVMVALRPDGRIVVTSPSGDVELHTRDGSLVAATRVADLGGHWHAGPMAVDGFNNCLVGIGQIHGRSYVETLDPALESKGRWTAGEIGPVWAITVLDRHAYLLSRSGEDSTVEQYSLDAGLGTPTGNCIRFDGNVADVASNGLALFILWEAGTIAVVIPPRCDSADPAEWHEVARCSLGHGHAEKLTVVPGTSRLAVSVTDNRGSRVELVTIEIAR
jgi:Homeodomain-like domain